MLLGESPTSPEDHKIIDKKEALYVGCRYSLQFMKEHTLYITTLYRAYANAIELAPESALFWHDLAVGYLYLGQVKLAS